jgi:hypothetical protein
LFSSIFHRFSSSGSSMKSKTRAKAVSYLRCSGLGQVDGDTWARQTAAIAK